MADDSIRVGDYVSLYCEDTLGYVFNIGSSSSHNGIFVQCNQSKETPNNITDPHTVSFEVLVKNRYKSQKNYRKYLDKVEQNPNDPHLQAKLAKEKIAAEAEDEENKQEQRRQHKRRICYGQVIQLRHQYSNRFLHVSTTQTSSRDKNYMQVSLQEYNGKTAQFRIQPRYKVKSEGDIIQEGDQVVLESIKSPGQFLHSSQPYHLDNFISNGSEINLGVNQSSFSIKRFCRPSDGTQSMIRGGSIIRLFHKEIEAYIAAEGIQNENLIEDVHLRERPFDQSRPKTMFPSTSAITYWQIEHENSILNGNLIRWNQQVRLRHMTTKQYLSVTPDGRVRLTLDGRDPYCVFLMHPVIKETDEITYESYVRIETVISNKWLHALKDEKFDKWESLRTSRDSGVGGLKWDKSSSVKIGVAPERVYDDAFTLQEVTEKDADNFNYVCGTVPTILNMCIDMEKGVPMPARTLFANARALEELEEFMIINGVPSKDRQKLLRNLRVVDLLVRYLTSKPPDVARNEVVQRVFVQAYSVLETYLLGDSRKNELYFARHIEYFSTQFEEPGAIGEKATTMITELIRDNQKIIDRIEPKEVDRIVGLVKSYKNYRFLDLLGVLCVCEGVAMPENQSYVCKKWLVEDRRGVFLTEIGSAIQKGNDKVYVSKDLGESWRSLDEFCESYEETSRNRKRRTHQQANLSAASRRSEEEYHFLVSQLDLFGKICMGRNSYCIDVVTKNLKYLTWQEAYTCLSDRHVPDSLRANYAHLIVSLFIDVGSNQSILDELNLSFVYSELGTGQDTMNKLMGNPLEEAPKESIAVFKQLKNWIAVFLDNNKDMTASEIGHNQLVEQVLGLVHYLVKFGYYGDIKDIKALLQPLLNLLDGRNDKPLPKNKGVSFNEDMMKRYQMYERFEQSPETQAVVDAKHKAMEVVELLLNLEFNTRLERFVGLYKQIENTERGKTMALSMDMTNLKTDAGARKKSTRDLKTIIDSTALFDTDHITGILMDLSSYKYDKMVRKSMYLLNKFYSSRNDIFEKAVQAQVLITPQSIKVHEQIQKLIPTLKQISQAKIGNEHAHSVVHIMGVFTKLCHLEGEPDERHPMNQTILLNHGVLDIVFDLLSQEVDLELQHDYDSLRQALTATLTFLRFLTKNNKDVQKYVFNRMDALLAIEGLEAPMAEALMEVFTGNQTTCLKIMPRQINKIVNLAARHKELGAEFLDLLCAVVKVEELDLPLKRNQGYVMKAVMTHYNDVAYIMSKPKETRDRILRNLEGPDHLSYLISMVDLFATCAEGENRFIESVCQTILSLDDLVEILNDRTINNNLKRPFLRFLLWVYLNTAGNMVESGVIDLPAKIQRYMLDLSEHVHKVTEFVEQNPDQVSQLLKKAPPKSAVEDTAEGYAYGTLHFLFDAALPFVEVFFRKGFDFTKPEMKGMANTLASALLGFEALVKPLISDKNQLRILSQSILSVLAQSNVDKSKVEHFLNTANDEDVRNIISETQERYYDYYFDEKELNSKLNQYSVNFGVLYRGENTCGDQLGYNGSRPYIDADRTEEMLPMGQEFQDLVKCFISSHSENQYLKAEKLIQQLEISAFKLGEAERSHPTQVELDVKCMQVLRAIIHNEERRLPEDWDKSSAAHEEKHLKPIQSQLEHIEKIQDELNGYGAILKTLPLVERRQGDVSREYLAYLSILLFNACKSSQKAMKDYCLNTREEMLFIAIREMLQLSVLATKERRLLAQQVESRRKEAAEKTLSLRATLGLKAGGNNPQNGGVKPSKTDMKIKKEEKKMKKDAYENQAFVSPSAMLSYQTSPKLKMQSGKTSMTSLGNFGKQFQGVKKRGAPAAVEKKEEPAVVQAEDDGHIELVLRCLASMCDGQNTVLQDYLRDQPDNIKSVNLVAECTSYLSLIYSSLSSENMELVIQLFSTLNEFASGNPANHTVIFDNNLVDYVNHMLRAQRYAVVASPEEALDLQENISTLLMTMLEESRAETTAVIKEICATLDLPTIKNVAVECYKASMNNKNGDMKDDYLRIAFGYHFILEKVADNTPLRIEEMYKGNDEKAILQSFWKNSRSIEIIKEGNLQRIRFRVKDHKVLRDEVKDQMKWNVDRSSSSTKIRELMAWSRDIIEDIYYQKRIRQTWFIDFLIKHWALWNNMCILLSLVINIIMLVTWEAKDALRGDDPVMVNGELNDDIYDPVPDVGDWYLYVSIGIGVVHNIFSLFVVVTYFLTNRPKKPNFKNISMKMRKKRGVISEFVPERENQLRTDFISVITFYYILFMATSIAGTVFYGYFFAFHFLNIVYNNEMLQRVIMAITLNGRTLLWVAVLGIAVVYIFTLAGFAFMRSALDPNPGGEVHLYCQSLRQCLLSMIRFGFIGELFEFMKPHSTELTFGRQAGVMIFHIFFWIIVTTIGLNIVFGVILDTFSELRSLKNMAEEDMKSKCYICNRGSYEFESYAKGFEHHVKKEHNMWAYVFFLIHLRTTKINDYTSLEIAVYKQIEDGKQDFFPIGRAMSLAHRDENVTEEKLEEITKKVEYLIQKAQREELEKQVTKERKRQQEWERKYREQLGLS